MAAGLLCSLEISMLLLMYVLIGTVIFFFGASVFSFINVVIYRLPRKLSFVNGRSMCPHCQKTLRGRDMLPVLNWFYLRGKCHFCGEPIALRYPLIEGLGGCLALLCVKYFGAVPAAAVVFAFLCILTVVAFVDLDTMEIPNGLVLWAGVVGVISIFVFPEVNLISRIIGIFSVSLPLFLITLAVPGGFGGGDIKLMAACGLFLGWKLCLLSLCFGLLTGGLYGIWLLAAGKKGRKEHFAFGPFLCLGMTVALFWGEQILDWYLSFFLL